MSVHYQAVLWNRQKKIYDASVAGLLTLYLVLFVAGGVVLDPNSTVETLFIRGLGTAAFLMLHVILCIGPLARLDRRFLPLLYNRRHLGVSMFLIALAHGVFSIVQFHALGNINPLLSLLTSNPRIDSVAQFPFELLGVAALVILFLMAATSHDYWLHTLSPAVWKRLHMAVYGAYFLLLAHVLLGALQTERHPALLGLLATGAVMVAGLHLAAAQKEHRLDAEAHAAEADGFVPVCRFDEIPDCRARVIPLNGDRVAVFRFDGRVSAVSNVCRHQNGPLGEGRIVDGCITCPWHGYQYLPNTGMSPPPFDDRVPVYRTRVVDGQVFVHPKANA